MFLTFVKSVWIAVLDLKSIFSLVCCQVPTFSVKIAMGIFLSSYIRKQFPPVVQEKDNQGKWSWKTEWTFLVTIWGFSGWWLPVLLSPYLILDFQGLYQKNFRREEEQFMPNFLTPKSCFCYFTSSSITREAIALLCSKNSESKGKNFLWDPMGLPFLWSKLWSSAKVTWHGFFFLL